MNSEASNAFDMPPFYRAALRNVKERLHKLQWCQEERHVKICHSLVAPLYRVVPHTAPHDSATDDSARLRRTAAGLKRP